MSVGKMTIRKMSLEKKVTAPDLSPESVLLVDAASLEHRLDLLLLGRLPPHLGHLQLLVDVHHRPLDRLKSHRFQP